MKLTWTAWNNGHHSPSGAGYGIKVPIRDRDMHFNRSWRTVVLEIPATMGTQDIEVNVDKASFWSDQCHELISAKIGAWLQREGVAAWPKGQPPKIVSEVVGERRFRIDLIRQR